MVEDLAQESDRNINLAQVNLADSDTYEGRLVGGRHDAKDCGPVSSPDSPVLQTADGDRLEITKKKIRFFKFLPRDDADGCGDAGRRLEAPGHS